MYYIFFWKEQLSNYSYTLIVERHILSFNISTLVKNLAYTMPKHRTIRRYTLEIEKIKGGQFPTFEDISNYLISFDFDISNRTLQRDLKQIRNEFGLAIEYNRIKNGYFIDYESSINVESFFRFLEIVNTADLLTESLAQSKEILNYISFDTGGGLKGIDNLPNLLQATKENRHITFNHYNYHTNTSKKYTIKPYLLKEYQNIWYVIGLFGDSDEFRTFGIDRIQDLEVTSKLFKPKTNLHPIEMFDNTIGLVYSLNSIQKVVLSFTPTQGRYIKNLPLHHSQTILVDNDTELKIGLNIIPNYELNQLILKHGSTIKVIEPKWLVNEIKGILKETLSYYK